MEWDIFMVVCDSLSVCVWWGEEKVYYHANLMGV